MSADDGRIELNEQLVEMTEFAAAAAVSARRFSVIQPFILALIFLGGGLGFAGIDKLPQLIIGFGMGFSAAHMLVAKPISASQREPSK